MTHRAPRRIWTLRSVRPSQPGRRRAPRHTPARANRPYLRWTAALACALAATGGALVSANELLSGLWEVTPQIQTASDSPRGGLLATRSYQRPDQPSGRHQVQAPGAVATPESPAAGAIETPAPTDGSSALEPRPMPPREGADVTADESTANGPAGAPQQQEAAGRGGGPQGSEQSSPGGQQTSRGHASDDVRRDDGRHQADPSSGSDQGNSSGGHSSESPENGGSASGQPEQAGDPQQNSQRPENSQQKDHPQPQGDPPDHAHGGGNQSGGASAGASAPTSGSLGWMDVMSWVGPLTGS